MRIIVENKGKIIFINTIAIILFIAFFGMSNIKAYYKCSPSQTVDVSTAPLNFTASITGTSFTANSSQVVTIPVSISNTSNFAVNYTITLSNNNLRFSGNATSYTGTIAACTAGNYGSGTTTYVQTCTARTQATADSNNYTSYWSCNQISVTANNASKACTNNGLSAPCYAKTTYNRTSCKTWGSASDYQTGLSSCSGSTGTQYKYVCVETAWTYSGS